MKKYSIKPILGLSLVFLLQGCSSSQKDDTKSSSLNEPIVGISISDNQMQDFIQVTVLEVIQVSNYTYLRVKKGEDELWIAAPMLNAKPGDNLYYKGGMIMTKFESKELGRTFDKILFVDKISGNVSAVSQKDTAIIPQVNHQKIDQHGQASAADMGSSKTPVKQNIKIAPAINGTTIARLMKNPELYEGKTVIIRGIVTKYTPGVMGKNWVHIQDGTDYNGKFELVITTMDELQNGETTTFEGSITLNKDLGFGYFFEVLVEEAKVIK